MEKTNPEATQGTSHHGQRIAFFGGSFDPPHLGHLAVARAARSALQLDEILFAPVGVQPLKERSQTPYEDRVSMTELAIAGDAGFRISLVDRPQPDRAPNYTIDTLEKLRQSLAAGTELFCLMGADSLVNLRLWHRAAEIPFAATLIVASRPGESLAGLAALLPSGITVSSAQSREGVLQTYTLESARGERAELHLLVGLHVDIRATDLRSSLPQRSREGSLVPTAVEAYIHDHGLYR